MQLAISRKLQIVNKFHFLSRTEFDPCRRLGHISNPSTELLMKIFRLSYFLLPYSSSSSPALTTLKQCLHYDPDSKQCLPAHRLVKSFDKTFKKLDAALSNEKWKEVVNLLVGSDPSSGFAAKFDEALHQHTTSENSDLTADIPLPSPKKISPKREMILRALCKSYTQLNQPVKGEQYCADLLAMNDKGEDADGLVGMAEAALKKEEWEDAVRMLEKAFEASGRSSRDVSKSFIKMLCHSPNKRVLIGLLFL